MAGTFGGELKERIREANDIVDVINGYFPLKRAGANFMALCPFHREKTPSFNVNPAKQIFHCFGCHKGGDVFTFVQEYENLSFMEAAKRLAERARIPWEWERGAGDPEQGSKKERLYKIHQELTRRWHELLLNDEQGKPGRDYLSKRGISDLAVEQFQIGFAPERWDDTLNWARSKGYEEAFLEQTGLVTRKEGSQHFYDRFRKRLMFPIADPYGRVIAFSGRVIDDSERGGKYVNSPETLVFKQSQVLFGLDKARRAASEAGMMVVCEGQLDTIACHVNGIKNVVAPQGTALTAQHARVLKRHVPEVVLCFDSDGAGQKAIQRSFDDLLAAGVAVRVATLPRPHDPDSYIREEGTEAFQRLIHEGAGYFDYLLEFLSAQHDRGSDSGRRAIVQTMSASVNLTGDAVLIDTYAQKTSQVLGVSVDAVRREFSKGKPSPAVETFEPEEADRVEEEIPRPSALEFWLLKLIVGTCEESLLEWLFQHLDMDWVRHRSVKQALIFRLDRLVEHQAFDVPELLASFSNGEATSLVTEAAAEQRSIPNPQEQLSDIVLRLRNLHIDEELRRLAQAPGEAGEDEMVQAAQMLDLQRLKRQPLEMLADA